LLTDHDIYLFKEGTHSRLYEKFGCQLGERDGVAVPGEPRVCLDDLGQQRARQRHRGVPQGEETEGGLLGDHRAAPLLDQLHQAVGCV